LYNSWLNERWAGALGWFLKPSFHPSQGKIPVRFEWKIGKNSRIIMATLAWGSLRAGGSSGGPGWFFVCLSSVISTIGRIKKYILQQPTLLVRLSIIDY